MYYLGLIFVILSSIYSFSYAAYAWKNNSKTAAVGTVIAVFLAIGFTLFLMSRT